MNERNQKIAIIVGVILLLISVFIIAYILFGSKFTTKDPDVEFGGDVYQSADAQEYATVEAITGLNFYKSKEEQDVFFNNNPTNKYAEKITIYLVDGTIVYSSDYLAPGDHIYKIKVVGLTDPGIYSGLIVYTFYTLDEKHTFVSRLETPVEIRYLD